jgi:hypothetical protein
MPIEQTSVRSSIRLAAGLALAGTLLSGAAVQASSPDRARDADPAADAVNQVLGLGSSRLFQLDVPGTPGVPLQTVVEIDGQWVTLDLYPHSVRSEHYQLYSQADDGTLVPEIAGPVRTLRGTILEMPGSFVAGSLLEAGLQLMIDPNDGAGRLWMEPVDHLVEGVAPGTHTMYRDGETTPVFGGCGTVGADAPDDEPQVEDAQGGIAGGCVDLFVTELACDSDYEYYVDYGQSVSAAESQINSIINVMNNQYETQVQITHEITTLIVRSSSNDPYSDNNEAGAILNEFRSYWLGNQGGVQRDVAQIFTGKAMAGSTIGIAFTIGGICTTSAYCVSENIGNFACRTDLSAHELGHLWGCFHCAGGCNTTMNSGLACANTFNSTSINSAISHRNSRACLVNNCIPANDLCANAIPVTGGATAFDTTSAFANGPAENICANNGDSNLDSDVWFAYQSPCDGPITIDLCSSSYNTKVSVYDFSCPEVVNLALACDDDSCGSGGTRSRLTFDASGGLQYYIRVGGFEGAQGSGLMDIIEPECLPAPANDNCGTATTAGLGVTAYTSIGATTDGFDEAGCDASATFLNDVWYRYFALADGTLQIDADGDFDPRLAVYGSSCPTGPDQAIACNDDGGPGLLPSITIPVTANTLYRIRVGSADGSTGSGNITLSTGPIDDPCPGDTNGDNVVDIDDIVNVVLDFGTDGTDNGGDVDMSGLTDIDDIVFVVLNFGNTCP